ncbi:hypothetical protein DL89DRAFT_219533 [Linderina pennispora]|uniref:Uncharacterized protein n=1 Tax=Linderina pennispora TaxID=61395 RepID=A0A1Y1WK48_9FUNG|nr:uncharacterized protein DL89DRAFT_219533 [Linderina pennispora]ORX73951.1 hypothetical protein DL89DRAFT_219533 [Linderina pennispora]
MRTVMEMRMVAMSGAIRAKPGWTVKMQDGAIRQKWTTEAKSQGLTDLEIKYVLEELDYYAKLKDWHPSTNEQVLNLIHPSLYPLFYDGSFLCQPIASPAAALEPLTIKQYCWLPSEFHVRDDGSVEVESYINNLHPVRHAKLYPTIANIFARFVPMFENMVTDLAFMQDGNPDLVESDGADSGESDVVGFDDEYRRWLETREFIPPPPEEFKMPDRPIPAFSFRSRRLQAIVKMSNIVLTPDKPEYEGGSWHVEAMANEHIVATGIYYYDVDNITESRLNFRQSIKRLIHYEQGDKRGVRLGYGIEVDGNLDAMLSQELGSVEALSGRCICFPNIYQHQVSGFKLKDPSKPGHRKILAFFLIDPSMRIPSTKVVPPQQQDWWAEKLFELPRFGSLPLTINDCLFEHIEWPMSLEKAREERLKLMAERSTNNETATSMYFEQRFNLCEHQHVCQLIPCCQHFNNRERGGPSNHRHKTAYGIVAWVLFYLFGGEIKLLDVHTI